jgi:hypothetical protein
METYPINFTTVPVQVLNELVSNGQLDAIPMSGDAHQRWNVRLLQLRQWPRSQAAWNKLAQNTGNNTAQ